MSDPEAVPRGPWRFDLADVGAVVVGYGLAGVLFRAFWPRAGVSLAFGFFAAGFYLWLGMAMSGPLLLLRRGSHPPGESGAGPARRPDSMASRTWAEMAWLIIGVYWIVLGVFVLPIRLHDFRMGDTILFGAVPLAAGLIMWMFGPKPRASGKAAAPVPWTHHVAVALLATWPMAWICLIVVGNDAF